MNAKQISEIIIKAFIAGFQFGIDVTQKSEYFNKTLDELKDQALLRAKQLVISIFNAEKGEN